MNSMGPSFMTIRNAKLGRFNLIMADNSRIVSAIASACSEATANYDVRYKGSNSYSETILYLFPNGDSVSRAGGIKSDPFFVLKLILKTAKYGFPIKIKVPLRNAHVYVDPKAILMWAVSMYEHYPEEGGNAVVFFDLPSQRRKRFCIKISLRKKSLAREISVLRRYSHRFNFTPCLVGHSKSNRWFLTDYHEPQARLAKNEICLRYLRDVAPYCYGSFGVKYRTLSYYLSRQGIAPDNLRQLYKLNNVSFPDNLEQKIPISIVYGGLIVKDCFADVLDQTIIVDWEKAHVNAVAYDLLHTYIYMPEESVGFLGSLSGSDACLAPAEQIRFVAMIHYLKRTSKWHERNLSLLIN